MGNFLFGLHTMFANTGVLFSSLFLMMLGAGLQGSLLGIRGSDEGFSMLTLSLIASGYYVGYFGGSAWVPSLLKRVGYIRVFAALVAIASVTAVAYAMFVEQYTWFAMRVLTGFCFAGIYIIAESWLNSQTNNENRGQVLGAYIITIFLGMSIGQLLLNFGDINGYYLFALASVIISVASIPLLLTNQPAPLVEESTTSLSIGKLFKRSPLGTVAAFLANFVNGAIVGMSAIYAKTIAMPTDKIALFVASAYIGVLLMQLPIGYISDRIDRRKVIIVLCTAAVIVSTVSISINDTITLILLFAFLGGLTLPLYALCIAYVNDHLHPEEVLPATSSLLKIAGFGNMIAPILVGYLMTHFGVHWFFGSMAVAALIIVIFGLYRMTKSNEIIVEVQSDYAPIGVAVTAATLSLAHEGVQLEFDFGEEHRKPPHSGTDAATDNQTTDNE